MVVSYPFTSSGEQGCAEPVRTRRSTLGCKVRLTDILEADRDAVQRSSNLSG